MCALVVDRTGGIGASKSIFVLTASDKRPSRLGEDVGGGFSREEDAANDEPPSKSEGAI